MRSKEFDLFLAMLVSMLKDGKTDEVIKLIEEARGKDEDGNKKKTD